MHLRPFDWIPPQTGGISHSDQEHLVEDPLDCESKKLLQRIEVRFEYCRRCFGADKFFKASEKSLVETH